MVDLEASEVEETIQRAERADRGDLGDKDMRAYLKALGIAALALALSSQAAFGAWYTARGSAPIIDGDIAQARRGAIDDALRNASLQAGADISVEQILENGTLLNERMQVRARTPIRHMTVIEEQEDGRVVTVLVKALIDDSVGSDCYAGNIKKTVLPFVFRYEDPSASLTAAGMEDFDQYLSNLIYSGIAQSPALTVLPSDNARLLITQSRSSGPDYNLQRTLDSISRRTQAQFIIVGSINSIAKSDVGKNAFTKMLYNPTRTARFNIKVFDVYTGSQLFSKDYEGDAEWTLEPPFTIRSNEFSSSEYGQRVQQLAKYAIADIVTTLRCHKPNARIVQVGADTFKINLGSNENIQVGMKFTLLHRTDYQDRHNQTYYNYDNSNVIYKVVAVSPTSATLAPANIKQQVLNVMLDDLVTLAN